MIAKRHHVQTKHLPRELRIDEQSQHNLRTRNDDQIAIAWSSYRSVTQRVSLREYPDQLGQFCRGISDFPGGDVGFQYPVILRFQIRQALPDRERRFASKPDLNLLARFWNNDRHLTHRRWDDERLERSQD